MIVKRFQRAGKRLAFIRKYTANFNEVFDIANFEIANYTSRRIDNTYARHLSDQFSARRNLEQLLELLNAECFVNQKFVDNAGM